ncbi:MAG TPA: aminotransferase class I/II-fold pyridoxal phosphate-dependent enzyme [Thermoanaerobaculia bacterium]|nr:aminotransferase class I/II-fold pyridoxal phosphate-dependent enzyme [Thermoanaerobaculia bacterium]
MSDLATATNEAIAAASPALFDLLSPLGRRAFFPPDIPFQAAQARGKTYNATIGQITDGYGQAVPVEALAQGLSGMPPTGRNRALLYSPVEGIAEVRRAWRARQRRNQGETPPSTPPVVVNGLTHGLALAADLFGGPGRAVVVLAPFWGNYRQTFALRTGARVVPAPAYRDGRFDPAACPPPWRSCRQASRRWCCSTFAPTRAATALASASGSSSSRG